VFTEVQREANWNKLRGKYFRWRVTVSDVLPSNVVIAPPKGLYIARIRIEFQNEWSQQIARLSKGDIIYFSARIVKMERGSWTVAAQDWGIDLNDGALMQFPELSGQYAESPEARGRFVLTHSWAEDNIYTPFYGTSSHQWIVKVKVKNVGKAESMFALDDHKIIVTYRDTSGATHGSPVEKALTQPDDRSGASAVGTFSPGDVYTYKFPYPSPDDIALHPLKSYEVSFIVRK
jgi:hypothetical protein